jgi:ABC-2 type transport system ATP-binding protein
MISASNLSKSYAYYRKESGLAGSVRNLFHREKLQTEAVKGIDLDIGRGELIGFIGPNGAGKTTTLKMISGILYPTSGSLSVLGYQPSRRKHDFLRRISLVMGQKNQLWWDLPAQDSFDLNRRIYCIPDERYRRQLKTLVERLEVGDQTDIQVRRLSLGERMKMELIAALLHEPEILLLDEPTIGLDVKSQKTIRAFIREYNREKGNTIMLTSHYMRDVQELCSRLIVIDKGSIIYDGGQEQLISRYADHRLISVSFNQAPDRGELAPFGEITGWGDFKAVLKVPQASCASIAGRLLARFDINDITIEEISLEDVVGMIM